MCGGNGHLSAHADVLQPTGFLKKEKKCKVPEIYYFYMHGKVIENTKIFLKFKTLSSIETD